MSYKHFLVSFSLHMYSDQTARSRFLLYVCVCDEAYMCFYD